MEQGTQRQNVTVHRPEHGWQPILPVRPAGMGETPVNKACEDAEKQLRKRLLDQGRDTSNAEATFQLLGDVVSVPDCDGLHIVSKEPYKIKVILALNSGEIVESCLEWDIEGKAKLIDCEQTGSL